MRGILIDWLVQVHLRFKLLPETLFVTVNLIDRYSELMPIKRSEYQLLGVTCMLIASKYEDINPPEVRDFIYITDYTYTRGQILDCETEVLKALDFDLTFPTSFRFLERYAQLVDADELEFVFAQYLIELALVEVKMNKWTPSKLASAAIFLAKKILKRPSPWCATMARNTGYRERQVRDCARDLCINLNLATRKKNKHFESVFKKFSITMFHGVAEIPVKIRQEAMQEL